jgi:molybdopterin adenylyltransferase
MALVRFFASAREATSTATWRCDASTVGELLDRAVAEFGPSLGTLLPYCTVIVGDEKAPLHSSVSHDSEVAVLPPVSGGSGAPAELRIAVLTISDRAATGTYDDRTGPALQERCRDLGFTMVAEDLVADDEDRIAAVLDGWVQTGVADVVLTNGGTGIGPRDVTPEATRRVIERELPGLAEAMRASGRRHTPLADLSRQVAGVAQHTLIVNLPGSPTAAVQCLDAVAGAFSHAVDLLRGKTHAHV